MSESYLAPSLAEPEPSDEPVLTPIAEFAETEEEGAAALLGSQDENLLPVGGDSMLYGDGGSGKTTLAIDLAMHLATGRDWLGIPVSEPIRVLIIEGEGPRPLFRRKLARKLAGWDGDDPGDKLRVWEHPWGGFTYSDPEMRAQLARLTFDLEIQLVIAGPVTQLGMDDAGTMQEVRAFAGLIAAVRERALRPLASLLIHHESKAGRVSGAWEGVGETLLHLQGQGHGHARLYIQKARWAHDYHATTMHLDWADGDGFKLTEQESEPMRAERIWDEIETFVKEHPGTGWRAVRESLGGKGEYVTRRRDQMLESGLIVNVGTGHAFELWHRDDPACPQALIGSLPGTSEGTSEFSTAEGGQFPGSGSLGSLRSREPLPGNHSAGDSETEPESGSHGNHGGNHSDDIQF